MKNPSSAHAVCASSSFFNSVSHRARAAALAALALAACGGAQAQQPYLGELRAFAFNYCPKNWTAANGPTLPIPQNSELFALTGTTYGGNGTSNFMLPDLGGRKALGSGTDLQGNSYARGQTGGQDAVTLTTAQMPAHTHGHVATTAPATHATPTAGALLAQAQNAGLYSTNANTALATAATGSGLPVSTRDPYLAITWCVATSGVFPSAN